MIISVNGRIVEDTEAAISVYDHGFLYGLGLFETFRTYNGLPFLLQEHIARIHEGCRVVGIPHVAEEEAVREQISMLLRANGLEDASIRYTVTAGVHELGLAKALTANPTVIIYVRPLSPVNEWYMTGRPIQILKTVRPIPETNRRLKSLQYMNGWMAKQELMGYAWASEAEGIQLNERSELTEGIVSNLFFVKDRVVHTPSLETGALPGITREFVLRLIEMCGLSGAEGSYRTQDLLEADEIFITNSVQEIVPVREVYLPDGSCRQLPVRAPGPVTRQLMELYGKHVRSDAG